MVYRALLHTDSSIAHGRSLLKKIMISFYDKIELRNFRASLYHVLFQKVYPKRTEKIVIFIEV
jgi:hypothetical protein